MEDFKTEYHNILCKKKPDFLEKYISLPILSRLSGVGLLCGTDWTPLFNNQFKYTRLDHSIGTALITWNWTKNKKQTLASLLHDISTPAFSHVHDFKNGDALTQSSTEELNKKMINEDKKLQELLFKDGIKTDEVNDYHLYPICDNKIPGLSADRLEYMYPSGASLNKIWSIKEIKENYNHIKVLTNEKGTPELGFDNLESCLIYMKKFIDISLILQKNEDKIAMQLMADILSEAENENIIEKKDYYSLSEAKIINTFNYFATKNPSTKFAKFFRTFKRMTKIVRSEFPIENHYCVQLKVKQRYVDPLIETKNGAIKISLISNEAKKYIENFINFNDSKYGCVEYL